jgi:hypothetical protein
VDDDRYQGFFLNRRHPHRRYRSSALFHRASAHREIAAQFGLTYATTCSLIRLPGSMSRRRPPPPFHGPSIPDAPPDKSRRPAFGQMPRSPIGINSTCQGLGCGLGRGGFLFLPLLARVQFIGWSSRRTIPARR